MQFSVQGKYSENMKTPLQSSQLYTYLKPGADTNLYAHERNEVPTLSLSLFLIWSSQPVSMTSPAMKWRHVYQVLPNNWGKELQIPQWEKAALQGERMKQQPHSRLPEITADLHPSSQA